MSEIRHALRRLAAHPTFAIVSAVTLALGIGANVAIFSLVYGIVLEPLPYPASERMVEISHDAPGLKLDDINTSLPLYLRYREQTKSFAEIGVFPSGTASLTGADVPIRARYGALTASMFRVIGVSPVMGRPISEDEERKGASPVVLVSERCGAGRSAGPRTLSGAPLRSMGLVGKSSASCRLRSRSRGRRSTCGCPWSSTPGRSVSATSVLAVSPGSRTV
jgi:hypothetical protein